MAAWNGTIIATGVVNSGVLALGAEYEAVSVSFTVPVPAWYGRIDAGGRVRYFDLGWLAIGRVQGHIYQLERLYASNLTLVAPVHTVDRLYYWLAPQVQITVAGQVWV